MPVGFKETEHELSGTSKMATFNAEGWEDYSLRSPTCVLILSNAYHRSSS